MAHQIPRRGGCLAPAALRPALSGVACGLLLVACGDGDNLDPYSAQNVIRPPVTVGPAQVTPLPEVPVGPRTENGPGGSAMPPPQSVGNDPEMEPLPTPPVVAPSGDPEACIAPNGVSGTPRTLSEALILMNSLPKPTSLSCFLQTLWRPLDVYMTSSGDSLQPSPGARSPRTFIVYEPLVMSIVFEGEANVTLELGYRTAPGRSIKTEIAFPLTTDVSYTNLFDRVQVGNTTVCGNCHTGEVQTVIDDLPVDVFESDVIEPFEFQEVDVEFLRAERQSCDPSREPERCELLSAFFDFGTVQPAPDGIMF